MKKIAVILFFLCITTITFAQIDYYEQPENKPDSSVLFRKFLYGGNFSFTFGTITRIMFSPQIAYPVTTWFTVGAGADALYYGYGSFKTFMYGGNIFSEFFAMKFLAFHFEASRLNVETFRYYPYAYDREWNTALYAGLGYRQMIGQKAYVNYLILWDFNYSDISPYANPTFRFTFYF
ncbi:MAG: hypothetical protein JXL97_12715 [Bacteroidales bacterium]|nr:hypothetical protein [Bacteroidales bacterium]